MREFWIRNKQPTHKDTIMYCLKVWGVGMTIGIFYILYRRYSFVSNLLIEQSAFNLQPFLIPFGPASLLCFLIIVFVLRFFSDDLVWIKILITSLLVTFGGLATSVILKVPIGQLQMIVLYILLIVAVWYFDLSKSVTEIETDYEDILDV